MNRPGITRAPANRTWLRRLLWLLALWLVGVATVTGVAALLKFAMRAAGLAS